jgi:hypothetical protein
MLVQGRKADITDLIFGAFKNVAEVPVSAVRQEI